MSRKKAARDAIASLCALGLVVGASSCGDFVSDNAPDLCLMVAEQSCERACACTSGDSCVVTDFEARDGVTYQDPSECIAAYRNTCEVMPVADAVYQRCLDALASAPCVEFDGDMALQYPNADCNSEE